MSKSDTWIKIAIVEDNELLRLALESLVKSAPDLVLAGSFGDAESAIEAIPSLDVNIVLMDIGLPGKDGIEAIEILKAKKPNVQFMVCTVFDQDEKVFSALKAGASSYMMKSANVDHILNAIRELNEGGSPMSSDIARKIVTSFYTQPKPSIKQACTITTREEEILTLLSKGHSYNEIADQLFISSKTVKKHTFNIYEKLQVHSKIEAINKYFKS